MSLFNPDKVFASLVNAMGLQPAQIEAFVTELVTELRTMKAEREAFKPAAARAYQDVCERCDRIERKVDAVLEILHVRPATEILQQMNGARHERNNPGTDPAHDGSGSGEQREPGAD